MEYAKTEIFILAKPQNLYSNRSMLNLWILVQKYFQHAYKSKVIWYEYLRMSYGWNNEIVCVMMMYGIIRFTSQTLRLFKTFTDATLNLHRCHPKPSPIAPPKNKKKKKKNMKK